MEKKTLLKIRLRSDGTWEHVYTDGSVDQNFHQLDSSSLADLYDKERDKKLREADLYIKERDKKLREYAILEDLRTKLIEQAVEVSGCREAKSVLNHIMSKK